MAVEGDLKDIGLTNLVQMLCRERQKAMLFLKRRGKEGRMFFEGGEIVHATVGSLAGEDAVYQLLHWSDGFFRMSDHVEIPRRTITAPWGHLLLEGMRRIDKQRSEDAAQSPGEKALSPAEIEQDGELEGDLILLLSRLEHSRAQLVERKIKKRAASALQILIEMVNEAVIFSEGQLDVEESAHSLTRALARANDLYPATRLLQPQRNRLPVHTAPNLYNNWGRNSAGRRQTFLQLAEGIVDILKTYFSLFTAYFRSSSLAEQWDETLDIFLTDLTQAVNEIRF